MTLGLSIRPAIRHPDFSIITRPSKDHNDFRGGIKTPTHEKKSLYDNPRGCFEH